MNCNKCDGTLMYIGAFKSPRDLSFKDEIINDINIPTIVFCFVCRCCDNDIVVDWTNGRIEMQQNYGTKEARYVTLQEPRL